MIRSLTLSAALAALVLSGCGKKDAETTSKKETPVEVAPTKTPAAPAKPVANCPAGTTLTALDSTNDLSAVGPFDLGAFTKALAKSEKNGAEITVYLSNRDYSLEDYGQQASPVKNAGDAYLTLSFYAKDGPVEAAAFGENPHTGEPADYVGTSLFVKDLAVGVSLGESKAEIVAITDTQVCGTFALHGAHEMDGRKTHFEGTFVAPLSAQ